MCTTNTELHVDVLTRKISTVILVIVQASTSCRVGFVEQLLSCSYNNLMPRVTVWSSFISFCHHFGLNFAPGAEFSFLRLWSLKLFEQWFCFFLIAPAGCVVGSGLTCRITPNCISFLSLHVVVSWFWTRSRAWTCRCCSWHPRCVSNEQSRCRQDIQKQTNKKKNPDVPDTTNESCLSFGESSAEEPRGGWWRGGVTWEWSTVKER